MCVHTYELVPLLITVYLPLLLEDSEGILSFSEALLGCCCGVGLFWRSGVEELELELIWGRDGGFIESGRLLPCQLG